MKLAVVGEPVERGSQVTRRLVVAAIRLILSDAFCGARSARHIVGNDGTEELRKLLRRRHTPPYRLPEKTGAKSANELARSMDVRMKRMHTRCKTTRS